MENRKEFTFPSADGRTAIHAVEWHPAGEPAGILQIAHGVAEYALRYEPFARFLNAHGFLVVANDHLGHGESVAEGAPRLYFGEKGSWQHVVDDMYTLRCRTGEAYPELPYFIMGHSMGSFLTRTYLDVYKRQEVLCASSAKKSFSFSTAVSQSSLIHFRKSKMLISGNQMD